MGGELFKEGFRKLLSQEGNYLKKQIIKNSVCQKVKQKSNCTRKTISCLYQFANIKTEFKELKNREKCTQRFILVHSKPRATSILLRNH